MNIDYEIEKSLNMITHSACVKADDYIKDANEKVTKTSILIDRFIIYNELLSDLTYIDYLIDKSGDDYSTKYFLMSRKLIAISKAKARIGSINKSIPNNKDKKLTIKTNGVSHLSKDQVRTLISEINNTIGDNATIF